MSISVNDHKVIRALFTNFYSATDEGSTVPLDRIAECREPCGLDDREIISSLGLLQRKKFVTLSFGAEHMVIWTRKGIKKAESLGPYHAE